MARFLKGWLYALILLTLILACANERAITGGPVDEEAPVIVFSSPVNESVQVDRETHILIKFSEQMKKSTFEPSLQIWPRPPGDYEVKSTWTGFKVSFSEALDSNETYLLTLDKGIQDLRGNGLEATYVLAFSTGDDLNLGRLRGTISGAADIKKNGDLFLYRQFDTDLSELRKQDADYIFQPDDAGHFELPYLAERSYMLFYHWDKNQNKLIDGDDYFGRPELASVWAKPDSLVKSHEIWPQVMPLQQIKLLELSKTGQQFMKIRTNRLASAETLESIEVFMDEEKLPILGGGLVADDDFALHLDLATPLTDSTNVYIRGFQDTSGYVLHSDTLLMVLDSELDTLTLAPFDVEWKDTSPAEHLAGNDEIILRSSLPLTFRSDSAFSLVDKAVDSVSISGVLEKLSTMKWQFTPDSLLEGGATYQWKIETDLLFIPLNGFPLDSMMTGTLKIVNEDSLGSLKVMHMGVDVLDCRLTGRNVDRRFRLRPGQPVTLEGLPARSYTMVAYVDQNGNGRYESGGLGPAAKSEPFWFYEDEIKVRARWETDLGIWLLND